MAEAASSRSRVCLVTGEYPPMQGGVGDYTALLANHLAALDVTVAVATTAKPHGLEHEQGDPAVWRCVDGWGYRSLFELGRRAGNWDAGIVHLQYQAAAYNMHPAVNLARWLLRLGHRKPRLVVTLHDWKVPYLWPKAGKLRELALLTLASSADAVILTNTEDADSLRRHRLGRRCHIAVIPIGSNIPVESESLADRRERRHGLGVSDGEMLLGYFGFLNENKGVDLLLSAVAKLVERGEPVRVLLIGGTAGDSDPTNRSYERQIKALAAMPALRDRVIWTGFSDRQQVSGLLRACDTCVLPFRQGASFRHGSLVAAIVHGLPIITTQPPGRHGPLGEVGDLRPLVDGENALLVPAGCVEPLADAIRSLRAAPEKRAALGAGASRLATQFDWRTIAAQTITLYDAVLSS